VTLLVIKLFNNIWESSHNSKGLRYFDGDTENREWRLWEDPRIIIIGKTDDEECTWWKAKMKLRSLMHCTFSRRGNMKESANVSCTSFRLETSIMDIVRSCPAFIFIRRETKVCLASCRIDRANFAFSVFRTVSIFHVLRNCTFKWINWNSRVKFRASVVACGFNLLNFKRSIPVMER